MAVSRGVVPLRGALGLYAPVGRELRACAVFVAGLPLLFGAIVLDERVDSRPALGTVALATAHAHALIALEQRLHLWVEPAAQRWLLHQTLLPAATALALMTALYLGAHALLALGTTGILFVWRPAHYWPFVWAMWWSNLLAIAIFNLYPLCPPRLLPPGGAGASYRFADLIFGGTSQAMGTLSFAAYAAMLSVHAAWSLLVAWGLWTTWPAWPVRLAACCYPPLMLAGILATGNHYLIDALAGAAVATAGIVAQRLWRMLVMRLSTGRSIVPMGKTPQADGLLAWMRRRARGTGIAG